MTQMLTKLALSFLLFIVTTTLVQADTNSTPTLLTPDKIQWVAAPPSKPAGTKVANLFGNAEKSGLFVLRWQYTPNIEIKPHYHDANEVLTVISGVINYGIGDVLDKNNSQAFPAGSLIVIPAKTHHYLWTGSEGAVVQLNSVGPWKIHYLKD